MDWVLSLAFISVALIFIGLREKEFPLLRLFFTAFGLFLLAMFFFFLAGYLANYHYVPQQYQVELANATSIAVSTNKTVYIYKYELVTAPNTTAQSYYSQTYINSLNTDMYYIGFGILAIDIVYILVDLLLVYLFNNALKEASKYGRS